MQPVVPSSTDVTVSFVVLDSTTFLPYESLTHATAGLALWYRKGALGSVTALTESTLTNITDAHADGGLKHADDGVYRLDLPDAAIPTAENEVTVWGGTATGYIILGGALVGKATPLTPTVAGRTLDVSAGGEAGVDWANVGSPTTAVNLSATNIDVDQVVASVTGAVGSVTGAVGSVTGAVGSVTGAVGSVTGNVGGNVAGSVGSVTGAVGSVTGNVGGNVTGSVGSVAAGGITASSIATGAVDADALAADAVAELADGVWDEALSGHAVAGSAGAALSAAGSAGDPWSTALPGAYASGTAGYIIGNIVANVWDRLTSAMSTAGSIGAYIVARLATAGIAITNRGLASGGIRLVQGDAYLAADSSNITFTFTNSQSYSLSGKTGRLTATNHAGDSITITASFAQASTTVTVTLGDVTAATSAAWVPGSDYHGQLEADVSASGPVTVLEMTVEIVADIA